MVELVFVIQIRPISLYCKVCGQQYNRNVCQGNGGKKNVGTPKNMASKKIVITK